MAWDSGRVAIFPSAPVRMGDLLYFYYTAGANYHGPAPPRDLPEGSQQPSGLCLATLRADGFAGMRAEGEGRLRTRPLFMAHPYMTINVDALGGACRVGLLDEGGVPIPGYEAADMDPIEDDAVDRRLRWKGNDSVSELYGRWICIDIRLERAEVYAIKLVSEPGRDTV